MATNWYMTGRADAEKALERCDLLSVNEKPIPVLDVDIDPEAARDYYAGFKDVVEEESRCAM